MDSIRFGTTHTITLLTKKTQRRLPERAARQINAFDIAVHELADNRPKGLSLGRRRDEPSNDQELTWATQFDIETQDVVELRPVAGKSKPQKVVVYSEEQLDAYIASEVEKIRAKMNEDFRVVKPGNAEAEEADFAILHEPEFDNGARV